MDILFIAISVGVLATCATVILMMMRRREEGRRIGREAEKLNVTSNDTRRSFWSSSADAPSDGDSGGGNGGGGGGD